MDILVQQQAKYNIIPFTGNDDRRGFARKRFRKFIVVMEKSLYRAQTRYLFHTPVKIKIPIEYGDVIFDRLFEIPEQIDARLNSYKRGSEIDRINRNAGKYTEISDATIRLLKKVISFSEYFEGKYDITIMPLLRLWGFYRKNTRSIPSGKEIENKRSLVDYKKIEINGNRIRIDKGQEIVTGSFLKAYAVDKIVEKMKELGIDDAIVNAGGSTIAALNNAKHPYWNIRLQNIGYDEDAPMLKLRNQCYTTSSQNETFISIRGKHYGHILNPLSGYPSANRETGMLTEDCLTGDILSTAFFNETVDTFHRKMSFLSKNQHVEGFLIDRFGQTICSERFANPHILNLKSEIP